ncbi:alpha/beta hydrolase [Rhodanobacter sp. 115]|uniref:alpha/beta hydrolase n=1 Tax=Rhodanobacter sp. FW021-MT20 TaxID=1162282 RepID=UPI000260E7E6|nr:alpha/beta hydrolase [Rhodanobacter sp. 115]EIL96119.1 acylglycerol lipase [Rhodanobacter sp. 115]
MDQVAAAGEAERHEQVMADGQSLCVYDWPLPGARDAVLIVHGLGEHAGRYGELARWFQARGYAVRSLRPARPRAHARPARGLAPSR